VKNIAAMAALVLLVSCGTSQSAARPTASSAPSSAARATISAEPNPVPPGADLGTTIITWRTGDGRPGQVYVSQDGGSETLFAAGPDGSEQANWIRAGSKYDFRLYAGIDHTSMLGSVEVTRGG